MADEKQALGQPHDVQSYPEPPPPYSPYAPSYPSPNPPYAPSYPLPAQGDAQKFCSKSEMPSEPWKGQPPPAMVPMPPPTIVQPVIHVQTIPPVVSLLGPDSMRVTCPQCHADVNTRVDKDPSMAAYISAVVLFLLGCVCGCCLIPFCMDSCTTSEHYCPNCKKFIGRYSRG